jgi:hypothetical protein
LSLCNWIDERIKIESG